MSGGRFLGLESLVLAAFLVSAIVLGAAGTGIVRGPSSIKWEREYDQAIARAQAEKKLIIADMFTDWCALCKDMDRETFGDSKVIRTMADKYVWLKLNTETEEDGERLQEEFAILTYPTVLILDGSGEEVDRVDRFLGPSQFMEKVQSFVDSPDSLANLRKAVREHPDSVPARYALAEKLLDQNNYAKARPEFEKVVEIDPDNREGKTGLSQYNVALCLASQEKFVEAIIQLDLLQERFPKSSAIADATVLRGQIYRCCNELDKAKAVLREYVTKYPTQGHIQEVENLLVAMEAESKGK